MTPRPDSARILAIDAGNTRIKWGVHDGHSWTAAGAVDSAQASRIAGDWGALGPVDLAIASNVAGDAVQGHLERACEALGVALTTIHAEREGLGVTNGYRDPRQLGSDRWAALVAAHAALPGHKLVVNAGTALTIDALAQDGRFLGGLIVPGPDLMARALDHGTAALRQVEGRFEEFPASTPDAIASGALQACVGAILRLRDTMAARGFEPAAILLSGGAAARIAERLPIACAIHENLVLDGLVRIARNA
jgi:type III pantothenate kinase